MDTPPAWLQMFLDRLAADDLSAAIRRGYRYDLQQFIAWYTGLNNAPPELARLTEHDLITWRQHMMTQGGLKAASINRRLEAVQRHITPNGSTSPTAPCPPSSCRNRSKPDRHPIKHPLSNTRSR